MSLAFMNKKSWHTTNLSNVERVWIAERKANDEKKKLDEITKQIKEEQQIQELRQLQVASGAVAKSVDTSLDWMYEGPAASSANGKQSSEEFLLGKLYKPSQSKESDIQKVSETKGPGSLWLNKTSTKNDSFTRLHEDPMLLIKQREKKSRDDIINNPVLMARLKEQMRTEKRMEKVEKKMKKDKKERKEKKSKKEKKEKARENCQEVDDVSQGSQRASGSKKRGWSTVGSVEEAEVNFKAPSHHSDSREGYGLVKGQRSHRGEQLSNLGPRTELVEKKMMDAETASRAYKKSRESSRHISDTEKAKRLVEMMADASTHESMRRERSIRNKLTNGESGRDSLPSGNTQETFLSAMRSDIYTKSNQSMEERLRENRHYTQKSADFDSGAI
jgi:hypothetical protein